MGLLTDAFAPLFRTALGKARQTQALSTDASLIVGATEVNPKWPDDNYEAFAKAGYGRNELAFACITAIATSASEARMRVAVETKQGREEAPVGNRLGLLLKHPNDYQSQFDFLEVAHTFLQTAGNVYVYKLRGGGRQVMSLHLLRPDRIQVWPGDMQRRVRAYIYTLDGLSYELDPADVGHIRLPNPANDWYGLSPFHVLARMVNLDSSMTAFQKAFFENSGVPSGILNLKRQLHDQEEAERIRSNWRSKFSGVRNWHQIAVLDQDASYTPMALDLDKMTMLDLRTVTEARICGVFGTPMSYVATVLGMSSSSYANRKSDRELFWEGTLMPLYRRFTDALNLFLAPEFPGQGEIETDFSRVRALAEDEDQKATRYKGLWESGVMRLNETRRALGIDELPGPEGDVRRIPTRTTEVNPDGTEYVTPTQGIPLVPAAGAPEPLSGGVAATRALSAPGDGAYVTLAERPTAREQRLLALLAARRDEAEPGVTSQVEAYFGRVLSRVNGVIGRNLSRERKDDTLPFTAEDLLPDGADGEIQRMFRAIHLSVALGSWEAINESGLLGVEAFSADNPQVQALLSEGATRVRAINEATREALRLVLQEGLSRGYSIQQIAAGVPGDGYPGVRSLVTELYRNRAQAIARTEIGEVQNGAAAARYHASGIKHVYIMDGNQDEICAAVAGTRQTVAWFAGHRLGHPNCTRAGLPEAIIGARDHRVEVLV